MYSQVLSHSWQENAILRQRILEIMVSSLNLVINNPADCRIIKISAHLCSTSLAGQTLGFQELESIKLEFGCVLEQHLCLLEQHCFWNSVCVFLGQHTCMLTFQYSFYRIGGLLTEQNYNCKQSRITHNASIIRITRHKQA